MRVISDDENGLLLWHSVGSDIVRLIDADGNTPHDVAVDRMRDPKLALQSWTEYDILVLMRPETAHAVWWCFQQGTFASWYVNLETPHLRRPDSVDTIDHVLDIVVTPERQWEWKDADEFDEPTSDPLYFDSATAETIRSEGNRLVKLIEAGDFPFDGTHTDFRPDPDWPTPRLTNALDFLCIDRHDRPTPSPIAAPDGHLPTPVNNVLMSRPTIRIRRGTDLDRCVQALQAVHENDAYPLNWPTDPLSWLNPPRLLQAWIAEEAGGTVDGHVAAQRSPTETSARHVELSRLFVTPAARRRSLASALVDHVRSWAAEHNYDLTLNVTDGQRSTAVAFYEATGWRHTHTTDADWTTPDGRPVKLRHYILTSRTSDADGNPQPPPSPKTAR